MLLPLYAIVAIANIIAKAHNYNIDAGSDVNFNLRVKRYVDSSNKQPYIDLNSDVNVNYVKDKDRETTSLVLDTAPVEVNIDKKNYNNVDFNKDVDVYYSKGEITLERLALINIHEDNGQDSTVNENNEVIYDNADLNNEESIRVKRRTAQRGTGDDSENNDSTKLMNGTVQRCNKTINCDPLSENKTENGLNKMNKTNDYPIQIEQDSDYYSDYENDGNFIANTPKTVRNNGPTNNDKNRQGGTIVPTPNKNNPCKEEKSKKNQSDDIEDSNEKINDRQRGRYRRSYYLPISKPGRGKNRTYIQLSDTYIPGYTPADSDNPTDCDPKKNNNDDKIKNKNQPTTPKNISANKPTGKPVSKNDETRHKQEEEEEASSSDEEHSRTKPKRNKVIRLRRSLKQLNKRDTLADYDYENSGNFIVKKQTDKRPQKNVTVKKKGKRPRPGNNNKKASNGKRPNSKKNKVTTDNGRSAGLGNRDLSRLSRLHKIRRQRNQRIKRSYYLPVSNNNNNNRRNPGYYPLSDTHIPGYNDGHDVYEFEGGPVYPYPSDGRYPQRDPSQGHPPKYPQGYPQGDKEHNNDGYDVSNRAGGQYHPQHNGRNPQQPPRQTYNQGSYSRDEYDNGGRYGNDNRRYNDRNDGQYADVETEKPSTWRKIKNFFGFDRKKRSVSDSENNPKSIRNSVKSIFDNIVDKIQSFKRTEKVVINENNTFNPNQSNENNNIDTSYITGQYGDHSEIITSGNTNPAYYIDYNNENMWPSTHENYINQPYNSNKYNNEAQIRFNSNSNQISNSYHTTDNSNVVTDNEYTEQTTVPETTDDTIKVTCFMCGAVRCPENYVRRGFLCTRKYKINIQQN